MNFRLWKLALLLLPVVGMAGDVSDMMAVRGNLAPRSGLLAEYKFNGGWTDSSGQGRNLSPSNSTPTPSGFATFNGTNQFAMVSTAFTNLTNGTLCGWFRAGPATNANGQVYVGLTKRADTNAIQTYIGLNGPSNAFTYVIRTNNTAQYIRAVTPDKVTTGAWYHIALVQTGGVPVLYVNGLAKTAVTSGAEAPVNGAFWSAFDTIIVGDRFAAALPPDRPSGAASDNIRLYGRALSQSELLRLIAEGHQ